MSPGVGGGGGGGCSFVYEPAAVDYVIIDGIGRVPGGQTHDIPRAVGIGEWDVLSGFVGEGAAADMQATNNGFSGAVRILKPGFY